MRQGEQQLQVKHQNLVPLETKKAPGPAEISAHTHPVVPVYIASLHHVFAGAPAFRVNHS